jgi:hypothetical protein
MNSSLERTDVKDHAGDRGDAYPEQEHGRN